MLASPPPSRRRPPYSIGWAGVSCWVSRRGGGRDAFHQKLLQDSSDKIFRSAKAGEGRPLAGETLARARGAAAPRDPSVSRKELEPEDSADRLLQPGCRRSASLRHPSLQHPSLQPPPTGRWEHRSLLLMSVNITWKRGNYFVLFWFGFFFANEICFANDVSSVPQTLPLSSIIPLRLFSVYFKGKCITTFRMWSF